MSGEVNDFPKNTGSRCFSSRFPKKTPQVEIFWKNKAETAKTGAFSKGFPKNISDLEKYWKSGVRSAFTTGEVWVYSIVGKRSGVCSITTYVMLLGNRLKSGKFAISFGRKDGL